MTDIDNPLTMKPLMALAVKEALRLAIADSMAPEDKSLADIDLDTLGRNLACRLLGYGGWQVGDMYSANSSPQQILYACVKRPALDPLKDIVDALGLEPVNDPLSLVDSGDEHD